MVLLQTMTRIHISATLVGAQILGAGVTMLAWAVGPTMLGPGDVFLDFSRVMGEGGRIEKGVVLGGVSKSVD
jgi:alpha-1,3-glucan synthase